MSSQPPFNVSPMIKVARWSMLGLGIVYGFLNHKRLAKKEQQFRIVEAENKAIRDATLAREKLRAAEAEKHAFDILSGKI